MNNAENFLKINKTAFEISKKAFADETAHVKFLLSHLKEFQKKEKAITKLARELVEKMPEQPRLADVQDFLQEYKLSTHEGVAIMCVAEALLRIPDSKTADRLIRDKLGGVDWKKHLKKDSSLFVNASTWGLMLTGKVADMGRLAREDDGVVVSSLVSKLGEPFIRTALKKAMAVIGNQFVMGGDIKEAIKRARSFEKKGYTISYDMLGEGARSKQQSEKYYKAYINSIKAVGKESNKKKPLYKRSGISVKLSSLHPRYELLKTEDLKKELLPKIKEIMLNAKKAGIAVAIDAEESSRLDVSLIIFEELLKDKELADFNGAGFVLQAYQKRAFFVLDYLIKLATKYKKRIPIRLVKGAYWDSEIKLAQVKGLCGYPVFTRKEHTDISYLACAGKILKHDEIFYPQFATHNALTIASIIEVAGKTEFEFQRLRGMGGALYSNVAGKIPCRVYAPVGKQEELLPYLIRRLLENGANTSFVNLLADKSTPIEELLSDPVKTAMQNNYLPERKISLPQNLYGSDRKNSTGFDLGNLYQVKQLSDSIKKFGKVNWKASPIINGTQKTGGEKKIIYNPSDNTKLVGTVINAREKHLETALNSSTSSFVKWDNTPVEKRAEALEKTANLLEKNIDELITLCMREAGKTVSDAMAEVREAADFCRYYAARAKELFTTKSLISPVGEDNFYSLHGRGVFLCISPWNFPLAIFIGQVAAALAAGNAVIAKPAEQTPLVAAMAVKLMHKAGIPAEVLHLVTGKGKDIGAKLVGDSRISAVVFTGSTEVAKTINKILAQREGAIVPLIAETGGQNCMVVDSSILPEQTVDDIINSAFGSAGQRCSALRVLYAQEEIADELIELLKGAMQELQIGDPCDMATDIGPVIDNGAKENLLLHINNMKKKAKLICSLEIDKKTEKMGSFVAPHVFEIKSISEIERENFGPILHVIRYKSKDIKKVVDEINSTGYGLTLGVQSRVDRTADVITAGVRAGNCYINRSMTGAVVGVQPFGGENLSGTGPKAGGPYYLLRFASEKTISVNTAAVGGSIEILS